MVNKAKILSDLSKMAVDAMGTFSGMRKELETIVSLRVNKIIKTILKKKSAEASDLRACRYLVLTYDK